MSILRSGHHRTGSARATARMAITMTPTLILFFVIAYAITWTLFIVAAAVPARTPAGYTLVLPRFRPGGRRTLTDRVERRARGRAAALLGRIVIAGVPARYYVFVLSYMAGVKLTAAAAPPRPPRRAATVRQRIAADDPVRSRGLRAVPGGRGNRVARLCAAAAGGAVRRCARQPAAGRDLGRLARAAVLYRDADTYHQSFLVWSPQGSRRR